MRRIVTLASVESLLFLVAVGGALAVVERGGAGRDRLVGTKGGDRLVGRGGPDVLIGKAGKDRLKGGGGRDLLVGGPGRDSFNMRNGVELRSAGNDRIKARDGVADEISCGRGNKDVAVVDEIEDGVYDCEKVREP